MKSKNLLLIILAMVLVFTMTVTGCDFFNDLLNKDDDNGNGNDSGSGGGDNGDIKVFAPSETAITQITIKNSTGKIVKTDTSRISAKGWRSYSVAAGTYTVQATISGSHKTNYATVTAGGVANVHF